MCWIALGFCSWGSFSKRVADFSIGLLNESGFVSTSMSSECLAVDLLTPMRPACFGVEFSVTAQFTEGDPTFEWIVVFMVRRITSTIPMLPIAQWCFIRLCHRRRGISGRGLGTSVSIPKAPSGVGASVSEETGQRRNRHMSTWCRHTSFLIYSIGMGSGLKRRGAPGSSMASLRLEASPRPLFT